jgi:hypothetical protein
VKGGHTGTCEDTFTKMSKEDDAFDDDDQRFIAIPDMVINPLDDRVTRSTWIFCFMLGQTPRANLI